MKYSIGVIVNRIQPCANIKFWQFEDLPWAAVPDGDITERQGAFVRSTLSPEVIETVGKKTRRNVVFGISAEGIDRFAPPFISGLSIAEAKDQFQFYQRAIYVVFL